MFPALVIVFREVLEAGLIIGIMAAATHGVPGSRRAIAAGAALGLAGSVLAALGLGRIAALFNGYGQELFNAIILASAVVLLAWHTIWMARHGRELATRLSLAGAAVKRGQRTLAALAVVIALAVLREGAEVALFLYGIATASAGAAALLVGGAMGLLAGGLMSYLTFRGLTAIPQRHLFAVTSWLIILVAAGLAGQAVNALEQGGYVSVLSATAWNLTDTLPEGSALGLVLHSLLGYSSAPSLLQFVTYVVVLITIAGAARMVRPAPGLAKAA